jgi:2-oxoglutarate ferredoxin oxidoreductase subunit alpha
VKLLLGNEAMAAGAIAGGASLFAGYPLAPSSEIDAALMGQLPPRGGRTVPAEDASAAVGIVLGAGTSGALGVTAMTAAALAGADDLIRYGIESRIPGLFLLVGGRPGSSRRPECASQEEAIRLRIAPHGEAAAPVWIPATSSECFTLTRAAATEARSRSTPVLVYADDVVAHLREPVAAEEGPGPSVAAPPADLYRTRDATILVVAFGIVARAARTAIRMAREEGIRAGLFRPVRLWPFPHAELAAALSRARTLVVAELNEGQLIDTVAAASAEARRGLVAISEPREGMIVPSRILDSLREAA